MSIASSASAAGSTTPASDSYSLVVYNQNYLPIPQTLQYTETLRQTPIQISERANELFAERLRQIGVECQNPASNDKDRVVRHISISFSGIEQITLFLSLNKPMPFHGERQFLGILWNQEDTVLSSIHNQRSGVSMFNGVISLVPYKEALKRTAEALYQVTPLPLEMTTIVAGYYRSSSLNLLVNDGPEISQYCIYLP